MHTANAYRIYTFAGLLQGPQAQVNACGVGSEEHMVATAGGETTSDVETGRGQTRRDAAMADLRGAGTKV